MKVLVNFSTLKSGGGQNVGLNFLYALVNNMPEGMEFSFLVAENSEIHDFLIKNKLSVFSVMPTNPAMRILKELLCINRKLKHAKIDVIYSYFGIGLFSKQFPQISGSAASNLYFPEIDFWYHYRGLCRFKKWIVDQYRIRGLKRSYAVIYENKILKKKAEQIFGIKNTKFIKPSVNFQLESEDYILPISKQSDTIIGLFLCGWQLNKNIMLIPEIVYTFKKKGVRFELVITAPDDSSDICIRFKKKLYKYGVSKDVHIIGPLPKKQLKSLYERVDFVFLLSLLESFSNNIIESWYFGKPLIVSDESWARSICKSAAVYVDRDSSEDIVEKVYNLLQSDEKLADLVAEGFRELDTYPTIEERTTSELEFIKYVEKTY